ncbi:MAG: proline--tRNA ligase, partial [Methanomassiliicoccales archaeon]|nr:proline--tRNA ligase [Methanomassiliicoccales archaeon]
VVTFIRRDEGERGIINRPEIVDSVRNILNQIADDLLKKARENLMKSIETIDSIENVPKKIVRFGWCGSEDCGKRFEEMTELKLLGIPYNKEEFHGSCIICGKSTEIVAYAARAM